MNAIRSCRFVEEVDIDSIKMSAYKGSNYTVTNELIPNKFYESKDPTDNRRAKGNLYGVRLDDVYSGKELMAIAKAVMELDLKNM